MKLQTNIIAVNIRQLKTRIRNRSLMMAKATGIEKDEHEFLISLHETALAALACVANDLTREMLSNPKAFLHRTILDLREKVEIRIVDGGEFFSPIDPGNARVVCTQLEGLLSVIE